MPTLNIEGRRVRVGDEFLSLSPEDQDRTVNEIAQSIKLPDDRAIDKASGASMGTRMKVGMAHTSKDQLATLQKDYPDAKPYGNGNFVYTEPKSGRPTLFNEEGLSLGDVAGVAGPMIGQVGGGMIGGALAVPPAIAGVPATGGASLWAVPAGVGLGAAAGQEVQDMVGRAVGVEDTRGLPEHLKDTAVTGGVNAAGARAGEMFLQGAQRAVGAVRGALRGRSGPQVVQDFQAIGAPVDAGSVTGNRGVQIAGQGAANVVGGSRIMQETAKGQADALERGVGTLTQDLGGASTQQGAGEAIQDAATGAGQRFETRQGQLYDEAFNRIGADTPATLPSTRQLYGRLIQDQRAARGARDNVINPVLNQVRAILAPVRNADGSTTLPPIAFDTLRRVRTDVGRMLKAPLMGRSESAQQDYLRQLYGSLSEDITAVAREVGPEAEHALAVADRYTRFNLNVNIPLLEKLQGMNAGEQAYNYAVNEAGKGGTKLMQLRRNLQPGEWDVVAATVLDRLGLAQPSARGAAELGGEANDFSVNSFMTNWEKLAPEARTALFGGRRYAGMRNNLDQLLRVGERVKDTSRMYNSSGTARVGTMTGLMSVAGTQVLYGDVGGALTTALGAPAMANITARMITSPRFVNWLVQARNVAQNAPNTLPSITGRLAAIAQAEPELKDEIGRFQSALSSQPR